MLVLLAKASHPPFIATRVFWRTTRDATVAALVDAIMQILCTVQSYVSVQ